MQSEGPPQRQGSFLIRRFAPRTKALDRRSTRFTTGSLS